MQKKPNKIELELTFDMIDSMVDDLTRFQFSILSWISCGESLNAIAKILDADRNALLDEINQIIFVFEVNNINRAVVLYSYWIEEFERKLKLNRGF